MSKTLKSVNGLKVTYTDAISYYTNPIVKTSLGLGVLQNVNTIDDEVTVLIVKSNKTATFKASTVKIRLVSLKKLSSRDLRMITDLATDSKFGNYRTKKSANDIKCINESSTITIRTDEFSISLYNVNREEILNLGYIVGFLLKKRYDIFGILKLGLGTSTNIIS